MAISIDHVVLSARNLYDSAARLHKETRLGFSTGEWRQSTSRHVFPLGKGSFIAIEGIVEAHAFLKMRKPIYVYDVLSVDNEFNGDHWTGLSLRVDSMAELEVIAKRLGGKVAPDNSKADPYAYFRRPDGYTIGFASAPHFGGSRPRKWPAGMPTFNYYPEFPMGSGSQPVVPRPHLVRANGLRWIELGGTEELLSEWIGVPKASAAIPVRFNGKEPGVWAVCVGREGLDDVVIRRPTAAASIDPSKYKDAV